MIEIREGKGGACFAVAVVPRASRDEIVGEHGGALKVRITAPPVEGKANKHLVAFLAKALGVPKSRLDLAEGEASKRKVFRLKEASAKELRDRLATIK